MVFLRAPHNYDTDSVSHESGLTCGEPTLAQQQFADECDINTIMKRFGQTGELPQVRAPQYGDFTAVTDYHSAMNAVRQAQESFAALPAEVRARFGNEPARLLEFCADASNRDEAVKLGLVFSSAPAEGAPAVAGGDAQSPT